MDDIENIEWNVTSDLNGCTTMANTEFEGWSSFVFNRVFPSLSIVWLWLDYTFHRKGRKCLKNDMRSVWNFLCTNKLRSYLNLYQNTNLNVVFVSPLFRLSYRQTQLRQIMMMMTQKSLCSTQTLQKCDNSEIISVISESWAAVRLRYEHVMVGDNVELSKSPNIFQCITVTFPNQLTWSRIYIYIYV